jgi:hypothetical protein
MVEFGTALVVGEWLENQILISDWTYLHCPGATLLLCSPVCLAISLPDLQYGLQKNWLPPVLSSSLCATHMSFPIYAVVGIPVIFLLGLSGVLIPSLTAHFFPKVRSPPPPEPTSYTSYI